MAERVRKVLPYIIHNNQCGCVKGRKIGQGIRLVDDIFENLGKKGLILIKDEEKAFDRVPRVVLWWAMSVDGGIAARGAERQHMKRTQPPTQTLQPQSHLTAFKSGLACIQAVQR